MIKHIFKLIWNKKGSNALMILEIFLAFLVLFCAIAYVFYNLERVNKPIGFDSENRWAVYLDNIDQMDSLQQISVMENLQRDLLSFDEIQQVSFTDNIGPFIGSQWRTGNSDNGFSMNCLVVPVDYKLDEVLNLKIVSGRWFSEEDINAAIKPLIVNQTFIDMYYPGKNMIDSTIILNGTRKIIGVVTEYRYMGEFADSEATSFTLRPYTKNTSAALLLMAPGTPATFEEALAKTLASTIGNSGSSINNLETLRQDNSRESWILLIAILSICGFLCINVALGLFGVLWYNISKRKAEIGLRQALGATAFDISTQFILEIMILTGIAVLIGLFFAIQIPLLDITEYEDSLFYKSMGVSILIIMVMVLFCALFPSIQAAKITPATSLHED